MNIPSIATLIVRHVNHVYAEMKTIGVSYYNFYEFSVSQNLVEDIYELVTFQGCHVFNSQGNQRMEKGIHVKGVDKNQRQNLGRDSDYWNALASYP
jgi:hypothetical protein